MGLDVGVASDAEAPARSVPAEPRPGFAARLRAWAYRESSFDVHRMLLQDSHVTELGLLLRPHEPPWLSPVLTYGVLAIEAALALLVLSPCFGRLCRRVAFASIVLLHGGIHLFNDLGVFVVVLPTVGLLLLAMGDFDRFERALLARAERHAPGLARFLRATGPRDGAPPRPAVLERSFRGATEGAYLALAIALGWRVWDDNPVPERLLGETTAPVITARFSEAFGIISAWRMFAPDAPEYDIRIVVDATLSDGRHVDPLTGRPPDFDVAHHPGWHLGDVWYGYHFQLPQLNQRALWLAFVDYVRRVPEIEEWEGAREVVSVDVWVASIRRPDYGKPARPGRLALAARFPAAGGGTDTSVGDEAAASSVVPDAAP